MKPPNQPKKLNQPANRPRGSTSLSGRANRAFRNLLKVPLLLLLQISLVACEEEDLTFEDESTHTGFYKQAAMSTFLSLNKSVSLSISPNILSQRHLETMWYVDYKKIRKDSEATPELGTYDPFLRIITVMEK